MRDTDTTDAYYGDALKSVRSESLRQEECVAPQTAVANRCAFERPLPALLECHHAQASPLATVPIVDRLDSDCDRGMGDGMSSVFPGMAWNEIRPHNVEDRGRCGSVHQSITVRSRIGRGRIYLVAGFGKLACQTQSAVGLKRPHEPLSPSSPSSLGELARPLSAGVKRDENRQLANSPRVPPKAGNANRRTLHQSPPWVGLG